MDGNKHNSVRVPGKLAVLAAICMALAAPGIAGAQTAAGSGTSGTEVTVTKHPAKSVTKTKAPGSVAKHKTATAKRQVASKARGKSRATSIATRSAAQKPAASGSSASAGLHVIPIASAGQTRSVAVNTTGIRLAQAPGQVPPPPTAPTTPPATPGQTPPPATGATPGAAGAPGTTTGGALPALGGQGDNGIGGGRGRRSDNQFSGLGPSGTITMDFRGSDIGNVLKFFAMAANWQIVPDAGLTGPVTIISPKPLTIDQAFQVLQSTLGVRGFTGQIEKSGSITVLKIVPFDRAVQSSGQIGMTTIGPDGKPVIGPTNPLDFSNQVVTQVIPVSNVDATSLSRDLKELVNKGASLVGSSGTNALIVTDTASNVQRIVELVGMLDKTASNTDVRVFPLKHSDANDVATIVTNLFKDILSGGSPGQPVPGGPGGRNFRGRPTGPVVMGPNGQPVPGSGGGGAERPVSAVPDTRTNSVIVVASTDTMKRVEDLIKQLDDVQATAMKTKIIKMQYANCQEVSDMINTVLTGSGSQRTGMPPGAAGFMQRVFGASSQAGQVQSNNPFASVVASPRNNSVIATATDEYMTKIDDLVKQLDVEVKLETTTFVIPLKNAQAADLAAVLGQAFGTTTGSGSTNYGGYNGGFSIFGQSNNNTQRQPINRRQNSTTGRASGRAAAVPNVPQVSPSATAPVTDAVPGVMTPAGFVPDQAALQQAAESRQFMFGGGGFGGGRGGFGGGAAGGLQTQPLYGRGQGGNYVNLLQLRQNVGVVPELQSNSLVVTTTPDNMSAIREIINSLDIIPRQVMIEVIIAEATLDATTKLGFQFDAKGIGRIFGNAGTNTGSSNFPLGTAGSTTANIAAPASPGAQYGFQALNGGFNALVQALNTDSRVRILSTPKVFTSNNQQAEIDITTNVPYATSSFTGGITIGNSVTYSYLALGVTLSVTPRITADGRVTIDVVATSSDLLGFDTVQSGSSSILAPRYSDRTTDTSVSVKDGDVVALGGLMQETKTLTANKVPLLGDIPILGHLFRSTSTEKHKTELMLFLVPHIVEGEKDGRAMVDKQSENIRAAFPDLVKQHPEMIPDTNGAAPASKKGDKTKTKDSKPVDGTQTDTKPAGDAKP